jgi:hypothetical protein
LPPPPVTFSMITGCPSERLIRSARTRPVASIPPPGASGSVGSTQLAIQAATRRRPPQGSRFAGGNAASPTAAGYQDAGTADTAFRLCAFGGGVSRCSPVQPTKPWSDCELLARRGHQRCHCNEEGFGTLSRQLGNDGGYRSSRVGVSGCFSCRARQHL